MIGDIQSSSFNVSQSLFDIDSIEYNLAGAFTDEDNWNGIFSINYFLSVGTPAMCENQSITIQGSRYQQCISGLIETRTCENSLPGKQTCELGEQTRSCDVNNSWGGWGSCMGGIYLPITDICP